MLKVFLMALAIIVFGSLGAVTYDVTVMANSWESLTGNTECNHSLFTPECRLLDDDKLWGQYKGLMAVKGK